MVNVHASILPLYRGAAPIQSAILNGDKETGVSIMRTVYEMDAGDVILCEKTAIGEDETAGELFDRLSILGAQALIKALKAIEDGSATFTPQDGSRATFCKKLEKTSGLLDFTKSAITLKNEIRAYSPWPSSYTYLPDGNLFKILSADVVDEVGVSGEVLRSDGKGLIVACGEGALKLNTVQLSGGKKMRAEDFVNAHDLKGCVLGKTI